MREMPPRPPKLSALQLSVIGAGGGAALRASPPVPPISIAVSRKEGGDFRRVNDMDLETIELIMAIEEEFLIEIPDRAAEAIISIGQLRNAVEVALSRQHREPDAEAVLDRVATIAARFSGVDRSIVGPATTLIEDLGLK